MYTINKVTKKSPAENCFCQVTCPAQHPSTATTHSKSVWTASLFFSVLVVPCYFGCFNPAMAARSANNNANVFLYVFHVPAHSPTRWRHQTVFSLFSIPSARASVRNVSQSYSFIQVVIYRTVLFPIYSVTAELHSVTEPSAGYCVKTQLLLLSQT